MGGPQILCQILKTVVSHVTVTKEMTLSHVTSQKWPCRMSLTILSPMSPVQFKKRPCCLSLGSPCRLSILGMSPVALSTLGV